MGGKEENVIEMSVQDMSHKVIVGLIILLFLSAIVDIAISQNKGSKPWIVRYTMTHYPNVFSNSKQSSKPTEVMRNYNESETNQKNNYKTVNEIISVGISEPTNYENTNVNSAELTYVCFDPDGFLFSNSSNEYLSTDELYDLKNKEDHSFKELLGFARNEIYARHGYPFKKDGVYYQHYSQYEWYNDMEHKNVSDGELNQYEITNVKMIVSIEEKEGFR